jgi:hypothetical protein
MQVVLERMIKESAVFFTLLTLLGIGELNNCEI